MTGNPKLMDSQVLVCGLIAHRVGKQTEDGPKWFV